MTSVYVPYKKNNLAAFVSVDSDATSDDYGKIQVLQLPNENTPGPGNIANEMQSDDNVTQELFQFTQGASQVHVRQPADAAGHGRADVRAAGLRLAHATPPRATRSCARCWCRSATRSASATPSRRRSSTSSAASARLRTSPATAAPTTRRTPGVVATSPPACATSSPRPSRSSSEADAAFKAGKVGQWATLIEEGRQKVDQALAILNENERRRRARPTSPPTSRPTGRARRCDGASRPRAVALTPDLGSPASG